MHHSEEWQIKTKLLIKEHNYVGAQAQLDAVLHRDPDNAEATDLQREIIWQMTREDEKKPVVFEGGMRQFGAFVIGAMLCAQPVVSICMAITSLLIHPFNMITVATSRAGSLGPMQSVSPGTLIVASLVDSCLGLWLVKTAVQSWRNS